MYQFFVPPEQIVDRDVIITGPDVNHIKNVLRMKPGEELSVSDGRDGREYRCQIEGFSEGQVRCRLRFVKEAGVELPVRICLFQGLPKGDKMEFIIQKAVELGVSQVVPVASRRAVVKLDEKKEKAKLARWQSIAEAAAKQCRRAVIPAVGPVMSMKEAVDYGADMDCGIIPYELAEGMDVTRQSIESVKSGQSVALFIGPEGGFEETEIAMAQAAGIVPVTLGKRILRTETAGLVVLSWLMYQLEIERNV